jgi:hypothetical protein
MIVSIPLKRRFQAVYDQSSLIHDKMQCDAIYIEFRLTVKIHAHGCTPAFRYIAIHSDLYCILPF